MTNEWRCPLIERGVTIYDDGVIRPCCVIDWSYSKPITEISNPSRFTDLGIKHSACRVCIEKEENGLSSRRLYNLNLEKQKKNNKTTIQYIDLRNTNLCNAQCQFCGPHHTNQWPGATLRKQSIDDYLDDLISEDLVEIYFAGGEPLISADHASLLKLLVEKNLSSTINLRYSTNLSVLKYKDVDFINLWKQYRSVLLMPSADGINDTYEVIRKGLDWKTFQNNLEIIKLNNIKFRILFILCSLNIFKLKETVEYFKKNKYDFSIEVLRGPDEFKLNTIANKQLAEQIIIESQLPSNLTKYIIKNLYE